MLLEIIGNYYNLVPQFSPVIYLEGFFPRKSGPISDDVIENFMSVLAWRFFLFRLFNHLLYPEDKNCETISKEQSKDQRGLSLG